LPTCWLVGSPRPHNTSFGWGALQVGSYACACSCCC